MIKKADSSNYPGIIELWERSVRSTHHFLTEDYLQRIKSLLPSILPQVDIYIQNDGKGNLLGFLGVAEKKIEMLFIHPANRGRGIGRTLTQFAIDQLGAKLVDVNEQNEQAVGFYLRMGFVIVGRTDTDGLGKPYPLLQMEWFGRKRPVIEQP